MEDLEFVRGNFNTEAQRLRDTEMLCLKVM